MAKTWKIPFKAFNGDDLAVYVSTSIDYADVTVLKGSREPFVTEMDGSDNLFTPVRTQTGYVRFIDETGNTLRQMIPEKENTTKVLLVKEEQVWDIIGYDEEGEPIYGWITHRTTLWQGYVQAQMFAQPWVAPPFEAELPVIDLLGALANTKRTTSTDLRTFGRILGSELSSINTTAFFADNNVKYYEYDCRDLGSTIFQGNWMEWNEDDQQYDKEIAMDRITSICTFFGWTCVCLGDKIYFCAPDDAEVMRKVIMNNVMGNDYNSVERTNIATKKLEDFTIKRNDGAVGLARSKGKVIITANANSDNSNIFSVNWPGEYKVLSQGGDPLWSDFSKDRHSWISFKNGFNIECRQYVGSTRQTTEQDILNYNKTHQTAATAMTGANLIYDARVEAGTSFSKREGLHARLLFSATPSAPNSLAFKMTSRDAYDFSTEAALKISGQVKIGKSMTENFTDTDWDPAYNARIPITITVGTTRITGKYLHIDEEGNIYTPFEEMPSNYMNWMPESDGTLIFFDTAVSGTVTIEINIPKQYAGSTCLPYLAISGLSVERVQQWKADAKTAYRQTRKYTGIADANGTEDADISLRMSSAPEYFRGTGLGITRDPGGNPYPIAMRHGNPEESLLYRMKAWYGKAHEVITVTVGIDYDLKPCDKFTYHGELYYLLSIDYQWRDSTMTLKLIKV